MQDFLPPVIFENGLYYELKGEQYYPCLLPPEPDGEEEHLALIVQQMAAKSRMEQITSQMAKAQGINEELKERDQMSWVGAMNNIQSAAREIMRSRYE